MQEFFDQIIIDIGEYQLNLGRFLLALLVIGGGIYLYRLCYSTLVKKFFPNYEVRESKQKGIYRTIRWFLFFLGLLALVYILDINPSILGTDNIKVSLIIQALLIFQFARLLDWFISNIFIYDYFKRRDERKLVDSSGKVVVGNESNAAKIVKYILYGFALILILQNFNLDPKLYDVSYKDSTLEFHLSNIISAVLIILFAQLIVWIGTQLFLYGVYRRKKIDVGAQYAINKLFKYVIYVFAVLIAISKLGIDMTLVWGGAAALLVGIGLGLQQTFNDFISGIILLFERSVSVGDTLQLDGTVGIVKKIGIRASTIETRDNVTIIVPNSKIVNENVINWTHFDDKVRFQINVGVAYGSDTALVKKLLTQAAESNQYVLDMPKPLVLFEDFSDSALTFTLYFYTLDHGIIQITRSDIRMEIDRLFREHDIKIPFPQTELWLNKNPD